MCVIESVYHAACQHYDRRFVGECVARSTQKGHAQGCFNTTDFGVSSANGLCRKCINTLLPPAGSFISSLSDASGCSPSISSANNSRRSSLSAAPSSDGQGLRTVLSNLHWRAFGTQGAKSSSDMYAQEPKTTGGLLKSSSEQ